jgi:sirohydrochlorin ferrochelatase
MQVEAMTNEERGGRAAAMRREALARTAGERNRAAAYGRRWAALRAQGVEQVVITPQSPSWPLWEAYYAQKGLPWHLERMQERRQACVPCLSPVDFEEVLDVAPDRRVKD